MTIATIMVAAVAIMSQIFLRSMIYSGGGRNRSSGKGGGQGQIIMLIIALAFAILAPIMIRLLYFALSRKREYLADASGARLTRYPEGLASALEKIGNSTLDLRSAGQANAPMYIANPLKPKGSRLKNLTSTHPPLEERIRILRAMGGGFSYANYQQAYESVKKHKSSIIPSSAIVNDPQ
jgi:heat shock protein HtpX